MAMRKRELKSDPCPLYTRSLCSPLQPDASSISPPPPFFFSPALMFHKTLWGHSQCRAEFEQIKPVEEQHAARLCAVLHQYIHTSCSQLSPMAEPAHPCQQKDGCCTGSCIQNVSQSASCSELSLQMQPHEVPGLNFPGWYIDLPKAYWA